MHLFAKYCTISLQNPLKANVGAVKVFSGAVKVNAGAVKVNAGAVKVSVGAVKMFGGGVKKTMVHFMSGGLCRLAARKTGRTYTTLG